MTKAILLFACVSILIVGTIFAASSYELPPIVYTPQTSDEYVIHPASQKQSSIPIYSYSQTTHNNRTAIANFINVKTPLHHFAIYPPKLGCGHKERTSENAAERGCVAATNAGFFDVQTGACIGNVISDSNVTQQTCHEWANFGLTKNGSFVSGYLTCDTIKKLHFTQLVQGRSWLVKSGKSYVDQSLKKEHIETVFATMKAPRVAIGHDKDGNLLMLEVNAADGSRNAFNLYEMADFMINAGALNAVNLDGGGSSTMVINHNEMVNMCNDHCTTSPVPNLCPNANVGACERSVTTIVCIR